MSQSEHQEWGRLTIRLVKSLGQVVDTNELQRDSRVGRLTVRLVKIQMSQSESQEWGRLTVTLVKSLGQVVDTIK